MRDLLKTMMTGSMIAGAALLVSACGGAGSEANNTAATDMNMDANMMSTNDVTAVDGATGMDNNMAMDSNMTMDANMSGNMMSNNMMMNNMSNDMMMNNTTSGNMTNGM